MRYCAAMLNEANEIYLHASALTCARGASYPAYMVFCQNLVVVSDYCQEIFPLFSLLFSFLSYSFCYFLTFSHSIAFRATDFAAVVCMLNKSSIFRVIHRRYAKQLLYHWLSCRCDNNAMAVHLKRFGAILLSAHKLPYYEAQIIELHHSIATIPENADKRRDTDP